MTRRLVFRPPEIIRPARVLMTGATGFLGAHLLGELLRSSSRGIEELICLVRSTSVAEAANRLQRFPARRDRGAEREIHAVQKARHQNSADKFRI